MVNVQIDGTKVQVENNATILDAAKKADVHIPTLCHMERCAPMGACRVCLVEVEGAPGLVASCAMPVRDDMKIKTTSKKARDGRKSVVELLLSEHQGDCKVCVRNDDCELQALARDMGIKTVPYEGVTVSHECDETTNGIIRNPEKCVKCRRCVHVCNGVQGVGALFPQKRGYNTLIGPAVGKTLSEVVCVQCGQCTAVCPVGAIYEKDQTQEVWNALQDPSKHVVVQTAPAIRAALGECFGMKPGTLVTGKMTTALKRLGFDGVFDTNFTADLTILEEGTELLTRLKKKIVNKDPKVAVPMFTSCSPGWIAYAENFFPEMLKNISSCKSPQQMFGALAKTYYAKKIGKKPEDIFVVSVMPCIAKKSEAKRPEMNASGVTDVDVVISTRELGRMIKEAGINFETLPDSEMDAPLGISTGAADIFANTGGVMEAALRTAYELITGRQMPFEKLHVQDVAGLKGVKEATIPLKGLKPEWNFLEGVELKVAVAHGLENARQLVEPVIAGTSPYHFIEVMTCPGGCIGGGGQPRYTNDTVRQARISAIYREDENKPLRKSHENPQVNKLYEEFLGVPLGEASHKLLHTHYTPKGSSMKNVKFPESRVKKGAKILCIDDDPDIIEMCSMILGGEGFVVHGAINATRGLEEAARFKPDLIILDVMMEGLFDGFTLTQKLRAHPELKTVPLMMLTSINQTTDLNFGKFKDQQYLQVDEFIEKPISSQKLLEVVRRLLSRQGDEAHTS